jgi:endonuclease/exonuclease/phosphatase family metal-dependent hydrolase
MRRLALALLLALALPVPAPADPALLRVLTRNVYVGFDVDTILAALTGDPATLPLVAKQAFDAVQATDFGQRAEALAREIGRTRPDVVGLQEVSLFRVEDPPTLGPATDVAIDFLALLQAALAARGLAYDVAVSLANLDAEVPALRDDFTCCRDIRLTDREVLLVRSGLPVLQTLSANFAAILTTPCAACPGGLFAVPRGWVAADVSVGDQVVRIVSTHLEIEPAAPVQEAQALELLAGPASTAPPVVLLGDFNSRADGTGTATYDILTAAGFADAWLDVHPRRPGFTCCHQADLLNRRPALDQRLDLVLTAGDVQALTATVVGEQHGDRTADGLWPSDHAGLAVRLRAP